MPRGTNGRQAERSEVATSKVLEAALDLFSTQGYGATSMRQIAEVCEQSVGNLYHHFGSKEAIFQRLIDEYWERVLDPEGPLDKVFTRADFPDDLEELAAAIEQTVEENKASILLVFVDVIEQPWPTDSGRSTALTSRSSRARAGLPTPTRWWR